MGPATALTKAEIPVGVKPIPLDGILKMKRNGEEKARVIVKGFHLVDGTDYNETFSGVPDLTALRKTNSSMMKEGKQLVHDTQRERDAVATAVAAAREEVAVEMRKITDKAECGQTYPPVFSELTYQGMRRR